MRARVTNECDTLSWACPSDWMVVGWWWEIPARLEWCLPRPMAAQQKAGRSCDGVVTFRDDLRTKLTLGEPFFFTRKETSERRSCDAPPGKTAENCREATALSNPWTRLCSYVKTAAQVWSAQRCGSWHSQEGSGGVQGERWGVHVLSVRRMMERTLLFRLPLRNRSCGFAF